MSFNEVPADRWSSGQPTALCKTSKLEPGRLVVADRKPFRIDRVVEMPTNRWPDKFVEAWRQQGMPEPEAWRSRPMQVTGFWEGADVETRGYGVVAPASHLWNVLPEHYAVCHKCFELPPCRHVHNERVMQRATERMTEDMSILPGCCHGCREPITKRQKSFTFPGANLVRPDLGDQSAIFHTRNKCYGSLTAYDKRWAAAESDRARLFFCEGTFTVHYDQSYECDNEECTAKGAFIELVDHRCRIWHHPGDKAGRAVALVDPSAPHCWCLTDADQRKVA